MTNIRVARRYAAALITAAEEEKNADRVGADVEMLERMMKESHDFMLFLKSPVINREKKHLVFRELLGKKIHELTNDFLRLLAEKRREGLLGEILQQFFVLRDERLGVANVSIRAAVDLSDDQRRRIQSRFEGITRKNVKLAFSLDRHVIGGFIARVGDTVYDGSVRRQLELLREKFAKAPIPS